MRRIISVACVLLLSASYAVVAEQLLAVSPNVERQQKDVLEARYAALHHLITREAGMDTRLEYLPIAQVRALLARREAQMQLGGVCGVKRHVPTVYTVPYVRLERHLITAGDSPEIASLSDIRLLSLGLVEGYFYALPESDALQQLGVELHRSKDLKSSVQMLLAGRVDAILANATVAEHVARALGTTLSLNYQAKTPYSERHFCYVLPKTAVSAIHVERINKALVRLHRSGELQRYIDLPYLPPRLKLLMPKINSLD